MYENVGQKFLELAEGEKVSTAFIAGGRLGDAQGLRTSDEDVTGSLGPSSALGLEPIYMLARIAGELLPAARCPRQLSETLELFCDSAELRVVFQQLVLPCLNARKPVQVFPLDGEDALRSVGVHFHDHERLEISDFYTGLGYILSLQPYDFNKPMERVKLLALYAKLSKLSAAHVCSRPPTTVQILWPRSQSRIALSASLAWFKPRQHFQLARSARESVLRDLWGSTNALVHPTPMQARFPNPVGSLFGTCWGDCAEAMSVSAYVPCLRHYACKLIACFSFLETSGCSDTAPDVGGQRRIHYNPRLRNWALRQRRDPC
ncbi:hypothetical protein MKEN_00890600 [Mycena kentingensis (nom. inval.)]|nr:hypothetical protein MKEN_00890600 [Mycena kentingensis (nom. inval.)]